MASSKPPDPGGHGYRGGRRGLGTDNFSEFPQLGLEPRRRGRFLLVEDFDSQYQITRIKIGTMAKFFNFHVPGYLQATPLRDGKILLLTADEAQARKAVGTWEIGYDGVRVRISEHPTLNSVRGTFYSNMLTDEDIQDLLPDLKWQGITSIERIQRRSADQTTPTPVFIVSFDRLSLPESVRIGYLSLEVRPYFPNPLRCTKCLNFGHTKNNCGEKSAICKLCANELPHTTCGPTKCRNCGGDHQAGHRDCSILQQERAIIRLKTQKNLSYIKAKEEFRKVQNIASLSVSYAESLQNSPKRTTIQYEEAKIDEIYKQTKTLTEQVTKLQKTNEKQNQKIESLERLLADKQSDIEFKNKLIASLQDTIAALQRDADRKKDEPQKPKKKKRTNSPTDQGNRTLRSNSKTAETMEGIALTDLTIGSYDKTTQQKYRLLKTQALDTDRSRTVIFNPVTKEVTLAPMTKDDEDQADSPMKEDDQDML